MAGDDVTSMTDRYEIASLDGRAGSAVFFDSNCLHASNGNITPYPRCNIFVVYNSVHNTLREPYAAAKPRPEHLASRDFTPVGARSWYLSRPWTARAAVRPWSGHWDQLCRGSRSPTTTCRPASTPRTNGYAAVRESDSATTSALGNRRGASPWRRPGEPCGNGAVSPWTRCWSRPPPPTTGVPRRRPPSRADCDRVMSCLAAGSSNGRSPG